MKKNIMITGATSGIGEAIAIKFASEGNNLIITGRREDRLEAVRKALIEKYKVEVNTLCFDVRHHDQVINAIASLEGKWREIDVLINNAGLAVGMNLLHEGVVDDWERMIDTNVKGLLYVSREIIPMMVERKKGHVINIGSIAGKQTYLKGNVYCASKHAVDSITTGMRAELLPHNIKVTQIRPGAVDTEFSLVRFKGDKESADKVYDGYKPLSGEDIAEVSYYATTLPDHVTINDMEVVPTAQASSFYKFTE